MSNRRHLNTARPCVEAQLADIERRIRIYSRLWRHGPDGQCQVWSDVARLLGPAHGRDALKALERYWAAFGKRGRGETCACGAAEIEALIVSRVALGDGDTAARLCRRVAPAAETDAVVAAAEEVARRFLGMNFDLRDESRSRDRGGVVAPGAAGAGAGAGPGCSGGPVAGTGENLTETVGDRQFR